jgi:6-phosphofructokinase 1
MSVQEVKKIGILTGGGDCPGLNAVIRGVVKAAINKYGYEVVGIADGFEGLVEPKDRIRPMSLYSIRGILHEGGTILGTTNRGNPFDFKTIVKGKEKVIDVSQTVVKNVKKLELDCVVVIGGDGTLSIALELYKKGVNVVGIPKTIDNDLQATDYTFGFQTAVQTATEALDKLHSTAESHHRVMVIEVMGRYAGWIAIESGIAGGADVILIPEIPFDIKEVAAKIKRRSDKGSKFSLIVVAEGAKPVGGDVSTLAGSKKGFGVERLGGCGQKVGDIVSELTGKESRVTVLGHVQRGGSPCPFDRILSTKFGTGAVDLIAKNRFGEMICLHNNKISSIPITDAINTLKLVDPEGDLVRTAEAVGINFGRPSVVTS